LDEKIGEWRRQRAILRIDQKLSDAALIDEEIFLPDDRPTHGHRHR